MARALNAKVVLLHAFKVIYPSVDTIAFISAPQLKEISEINLRQEVKAVGASGDSNVSTLCIEGSASYTILHAAARVTASLIIVGLKNTRNPLESLFGSTTKTLMRQSLVPLIVVPEDAPFIIPKSIALASDVTTGTNEIVLQPLKHLAEEFKSKVYVVRVIREGLDEVLQMLTNYTSLNVIFKNVHHTFEYITGENVADGLNHFVEDCRVNMLTVIHHEHSFLDRLFIKSNSVNILNHSHVPLLILNEKQEDNIAVKEEEQLVLDIF